MDYDGLLIDIARPLLPKAVRFRRDVRQPVTGSSSRRRTWTGGCWAGWTARTWDSVAVALRARLTDAVIDDAVRLLPAEYRALEGAELAAALRARRDRLPAAAAEYYRMMAREPEVYGSDAGDLAVVERQGGRRDGGAAPRRRAASPRAPYFRRRFVPGETREVRVFLLGGDDRAEVRGTGGMLVRVIGGAGGDALEDRGTADAPPSTTPAAANPLRRRGRDGDGHAPL